ncbi:MAG TPA: hypothetical protein VFB54_05700, partial [Burkholderiales bacterium]|nr:hypothetical protein [Burkholderiales bacterium]
RAATADALLNLLIAVSMFSAWMHLSTGARRWLYATHAAVGLGFLAKGPVAILVPFAVTFLFCWLRRDLRTWARSTFDPRALALFAVVALPWYIAIFMKEGSAFFYGFFVKHNVGRFGGPLQGHAGSLVYYVPVVLVGLLPFTALLVPLLGRLRALWKEDLPCFLLLWFAFVFVFFSLSGTKLPHYMLYGMSGIFVLLGVVATGEMRGAAWLLFPAALAFVVLLALPWLVALVLPHVHDTYYREAFSEVDRYFDRTYILVVVVALVMAIALMLLRRLSIVTRLALVGLVYVLVLSSVLVPLAGTVVQEPIKQAALLCRQQGWQPVMWGLNAPSFSVYRGAPTPNREPRPGDVVLTKSKRIPALEPRGVEVLYRKNGIVLLRVAS